MAQEQVSDLSVTHDLQAGRDKAIRVKARYNGITEATAKHPKYRERLGYLMSAALADEALMEDSVFTAAYLNEYYKWCMPLNTPRVGSSVNILIPWGEFWTTRELPKGMGWVRGSGTFAGGLSPGSTILSPWHEVGAWRGDRKFRSVLVSQIRGVVGNAGYLESAEVDGIRFEGRAPAYYDPTFESYGYLCAGAGENNVVRTLRADHFNDYGIGWAGATPGHFHDLTTFKNNLGGVGVLGGALATMSIGVLSGDDNPYLFRCVRGTQPGDGGDEGSMLDISLIKHEGGTNTESDLGGKHKGQIVGEVRGQGGVNIHTLQMATSYYVNHAMFHVHPFLPNYGSEQSMVVKVGLLKQNRNMPDRRPAFKRLFVDTHNKLTWDAPASFDAEFDLVYYNQARNGYVPKVEMSRTQLTAQPYPHADRLGHIAHDDARQFDEVGGNPKFYFTGPPTWGTTPPPTCTWIPGTPVLGHCIGGQQDVTTDWVLSPAGCSPAPPKPAPVVTKQACVTPPTGTTIADLPLTNTNPSFKQTVAWTGARTFTFTGLKATDLRSKFLFCNQAGDRIVIAPDGFIYANIRGVERIVNPNEKLTVNVARNVTFTVDAVDLTRIGDSNFGTSANANAFVGSWTRLVVKQ